MPGSLERAGSARVEVTARKSQQNAYDARRHCPRLEGFRLSRFFHEREFGSGPRLLAVMVATAMLLLVVEPNVVDAAVQLSVMGGSSPPLRDGRAPQQVSPSADELLLNQSNVPPQRPAQPFDIPQRPVEPGIVKQGVDYSNLVSRISDSREVIMFDSDRETRYETAYGTFVL